jgi:hypothetical protein
LDGPEYAPGRYLGIKSSWLSRNVLFVPAADVQIGEDRIAKLEYPSAFVRNSPAFDPEVELAQVEKEEINTYFGRFVSTRRTSSIEEIRPEETINSRTINQESEPQGSSPRSAEDRRHIESSEQAFFNQNGFVTDSNARGRCLQRTAANAERSESSESQRPDQEQLIGLIVCRVHP